MLMIWSLKFSLEVFCTLCLTDMTDVMTQGKKLSTVIICSHGPELLDFENSFDKPPRIHKAHFCIILTSKKKLNNLYKNSGQKAVTCVEASSGSCFLNHIIQGSNFYKRTRWYHVQKREFTLYSLMTQCLNVKPYIFNFSIYSVKIFLNCFLNIFFKTETKTNQMHSWIFSWRMKSV